MSDLPKKTARKAPAKKAPAKKAPAKKAPAKKAPAKKASADKATDWSQRGGKSGRYDVAPSLRPDIRVDKFSDPDEDPPITPTGMEWSINRGNRKKG